MTAGTTVSAALALVLGLRHGLDADHLAAIDGLTRWNVREGRPFARYCGTLFSAGHGGLVLLAAVILGMLARQWTPPAWLGPTGAFVSAAALMLLSVLNLRSVFGARHEHRAVGVRSRAYAALLRAPRAWQVALVGALFALSFDAIGLAALFAAAASPSGGVFGAGALALVFAAGMIAVDTANGLWVVRLLDRSDGASAHASRVMTLTIAGVGILVGLSVFLSTWVDSFDEWLSAHELIASGLVVAAILGGYIGALCYARTSEQTRMQQDEPVRPA